MDNVQKHDDDNAEQQHLKLASEALVALASRETKAPVNQVDQVVPEDPVQVPIPAPPKASKSGTDPMIAVVPVIQAAPVLAVHPSHALAVSKKSKKAAKKAVKKAGKKSPKKDAKEASPRRPCLRADDKVFSPIPLVYNWNFVKYQLLYREHAHIEYSDRLAEKEEDENWVVFYKRLQDERIAAEKAAEEAMKETEQVDAANVAGSGGNSPDIIYVSGLTPKQSSEQVAAPDLPIIPMGAPVPIEDQPSSSAST